MLCDTTFTLFLTSLFCFPIFQTRPWSFGSWLATMPATVSPRSVCTATRTSSATLFCRPMVTTPCPARGTRPCACGIWLPESPLVVLKTIPRCESLCFPFLPTKFGGWIWLPRRTSEWLISQSCPVLAGSGFEMSILVLELWYRRMVTLSESWLTGTLRLTYAPMRGRRNTSKSSSVTGLCEAEDYSSYQGCVLSIDPSIGIVFQTSE